MGSVATHPLIASRYRLDDEALIAWARNQMHTEGVCVLADFVTPAGVRQMVEECAHLAPLAHRSAPHRNPYLTVSSNVSSNVSANVSSTSAAVLYDSLEVLAYDQLPTSGSLRTLYESNEMLHFIRRCLGLAELFHYGDPLGALNVSIMRDGDMLDWHFDMTDFVVSIALQSAEHGGDFENAPMVRVAGEQVISALLAGDHTRVRVEPMKAGTLMLFNGRQSMHRVSPIVGATPRYMALLAYDTKAGTNSTDELKLSRYGRLPERREV